MKRKLTRRQFIATGATLAGASLGARALSAERGPDARPPNILFLMTDEHSPRYLGCYGHKIVQTPVLDELARRSVRFEHAYCQNPICVPSRMSLVTGKHPHEIKVWNNSCPMDEATLTIADALNERGYVTGALGKMHFVGGSRHGFQVRTIGDAGSDVQQSKALNEYLQAHNMKRAGRDPREACDATWPSEVESEHLTTEHALKFLEQYREKPFCVWVSFPKPHFPFIAPTGFADMYRGKGDLPRVTQQMLRNLPKHSVAYREQYQMGELTEAQIRLAREKYFSMISYVDMLFGRVLAKLDALGLRDDTIIVYTADHGEMAGEHGLWYKNCMFESGAGIPMMISFPKRLPQGTSVAAPAGNVDLFPTLMELAGHEVPRGLSGSSLVPLMTDKGKGAERVVFADYYAHPLQIPQRMIRTPRWKYWHFIGDEPHLYDMVNDPNEERNLAADPKHKDVVAELRERVLDGWDYEAFLEYQKSGRKGKQAPAAEDQ